MVDQALISYYFDCLLTCIVVVASVGGSPCNDFSRANPRREGFTGKWGKLFFDYARILNICKEKHEEAGVVSPFYWLFENVIMDVEDRVGLMKRRIKSTIAISKGTG